MAWSSKPVEFACQRCLQPLVCNSLTLTEYETAELTCKEKFRHSSIMNFLCYLFSFGC